MFGGGERIGALLLGHVRAAGEKQCKHKERSHFLGSSCGFADPFVASAIFFVRSLTRRSLK
jgi:hypothetical protein